MTGTLNSVLLRQLEQRVAEATAALDAARLALSAQHRDSAVDALVDPVVAPVVAQPDSPSALVSTGRGGRVSGRRGLLRLAGAAAVGGAATSLFRGAPAAAGVGTMQYGASNNAGDDDTTLVSSSSAYTLQVRNTASGQVALQAINDTWGTALVARIDTASNSSHAIEADIVGSEGVTIRAGGGRSQLMLSPSSGTGAPSGGGTRFEGEFVANAAGLWYCVDGGTPGVWRKVASTTAAGSFHSIPTARVYDSRWTLILANVIKGPLASGANRTVYCDDKRNGMTGLVETNDIVPSGATAVAYNLTVTQFTGTGFLAVEPGGAATYGGSAINWSPGPVALANASVARLDSQRRLQVFAGGSGTANFVIDIVGYYR